MPESSLGRALGGETPRTVGLVPILWRAGAVTGPLALGGALTAAADQAPGVPTALAAAAGFGAVGATLLIRGTAGERVTRARAGVQGWRMARGHIGTRYDVTPDQLGGRPEGEFLIGEASWPDPTVHTEWLPQRGHAPHMLVAGATGGGKSESITTLILQAISWGWDVVVCDAKGGTEFGWLEDLGYDRAQVHQTPDRIQMALRKAHEDMAARYEALQGIRVPGRDTGGTIRARRPKNLHEWRTLAKPEDRPTFRPCLFIVDELDDVTKHPKLGADNARLLEQLAARTRGASIHLVLGTQAPYAELLSGFVKANVKARLQFGSPDQVQADMVIGEEARRWLAEAEAPSERPPGRGVYLDGAGGDPRIVQAVLLDVDRLAPTWDAWEADRTMDASPEARSEGDGSGDTGDTADGAVPRHSGAPPAPGVGVSAGSVARASGIAGSGGSSAGSSPPSADLYPYGVGVGPASGGSSPASSTPSPAHPSAPAPSPPHPSARRLGALVAGTFRLVVTVPLRRLLLRATVWRLVLGPRLRGRAIRRDRRTRRDEESRSGGRCAVCLRPPRPELRGAGWQVEHKRPKWAGGTDDPSNLWTLCTECHHVKTRAEDAARKWRDRAFGLAALERAPAYVWGGLVGGLAAVGHLAGVLPHHALGVILAAVLVWGFWRTQPKSGGWNGVDDLDLLVERSSNDSVGHAAGAAAWWKRKWHGFRLWLGLGAHAYAAVTVVVWVVRWWVTREAGGDTAVVPPPPPRP